MSIGKYNSNNYINNIVMELLYGLLNSQVFMNSNVPGLSSTKVQDKCTVHACTLNMILPGCFTIEEDRKLMITKTCCSVQSRPRFCVIDAEYSILTQTEIMTESHCRKKKFPHK